MLILPSDLFPYIKNNSICFAKFEFMVKLKIDAIFSPRYMPE